MKKLLATFLLLAALLPAQASWITGYFYSPFGQSNSVPITLTLVSPVAATPIFAYTFTLSTNTTTNGVLSPVWLYAGNYNATVGPNGDSFPFSVPNDTNTYTLAALSPAGFTYTYTFSPLYVQIIGGTMQGNLSWNTTNGGLIVNGLTTAQRLALTPTNGMLMYDSTLGEFFGYTGGAWL